MIRAKYSVPKTFIAIKSQGIATMIADIPNANNEVWNNNPELKPIAAAIPNCFPLDILVDKTYIISGPGEIVSAKLVKKKDIMVSNVIVCIIFYLKSLD